MRNLLIVWLAVVALIGAVCASFWFVDFGTHAHLSFPLIVFVNLTCLATVGLLIVVALGRFIK